MTAKLNAKRTAKILIKTKFSIEKYQAVQEERLHRLRFWKERGIQVLIDNEQELVDFGEEVLKIMRSHDRQ